MPTLKFTSKQMDAFDGTLLKEFRIFMLGHLRDTAADAFAGQTDEEVLATIDQGIERAQGYGATLQYAYGMFIAAMVRLGVDFDTSGQYPWAVETLKDPKIEDANVRIENMLVQCVLYFEETEASNSTDVTL